MPQEIYQSFLKERDKSLYRNPLVLEQNDNKIFLNEKSVLDFSSYDYLNISNHHQLHLGAKKWMQKFGLNFSSSRLISGTRVETIFLEEKIASFKKTQKALLFSSGYLANTTVLEALLNSSLFEKPPLVFCDKLNHSSIYLGLQKAGATIIRFRHNDMSHLEDLLKKHHSFDQKKFIVTESLFSMDGDFAPLQDLVFLKEKYDAFLYLDEAHSTGVFGKNGCGLSDDFSDKIDVIMGTFSKAMGCFGAYIATSKIIYDYLIQTCKGFIYTTALPPPLLGAIDTSLDLVPTLENARVKLKNNGENLRSILVQKGFNIGTSKSHIIPIILNDAQKTLNIAKKMHECGALVVAIRPPTVSPQKSRLRISLNAHHDKDDINFLIDSLERSSR